MKDKLRQVRAKLSTRRKDSVTDVSRTNSVVPALSAQPSFLGLPAEIRNDIYHYLANSTRLTLQSVSPKKRTGAPGLLLACKQTWKEYRPILMTLGTYIINVHDYNFGVVVRTYEKLNQTDLALTRMNEQLWIYLHLGHVPSRDDRKALRAWCDYRSDNIVGPYFGRGQKIPKEIIFQYNVKFLTHMRPPRPASRYANGYEMKLDLLRSHVRMSTRLRTPEEEEQNPSNELQKFREDLDDCVAMFEELAGPAGRVDRGSVSTIQTGNSSIGRSNSESLT